MRNFNTENYLIKSYLKATKSPQILHGNLNLSYLISLYVITGTILDKDNNYEALRFKHFSASLLVHHSHIQIKR
jgi:hypothetical protein